MFPIRIFDNRFEEIFELRLICGRHGRLVIFMQLVRQRSNMLLL